jgi:hypothetical protein
LRSRARRGGFPLRQLDRLPLGGSEDVELAYSGAPATALHQLIYRCVIAERIMVEERQPLYSCGKRKVYSQLGRAMAPR